MQKQETYRVSESQQLRPMLNKQAGIQRTDAVRGTDEGLTEAVSEAHSLEHGQHCVGAAVAKLAAASKSRHGPHGHMTGVGVLHGSGMRRSGSMTLPPPQAVATSPLEPAESMLSALSRAETPQAQSHMWPHVLQARVMLEDAAWLDSYYKHREHHGTNRGCRAAIVSDPVSNVTRCDDDSDTLAGEDLVPVDCCTDGHGNPMATEFTCLLLMRAASP